MGIDLSFQKKVPFFEGRLFRAANAGHSQAERGYKAMTPARWIHFYLEREAVRNTVAGCRHPAIDHSLPATFEAAVTAELAEIQASDMVVRASSGRLQHAFFTARKEIQARLFAAK